MEKPSKPADLHSLATGSLRKFLWIVLGARSIGARPEEIFEDPQEGRQTPYIGTIYLVSISSFYLLLLVLGESQPLSGMMKVSDALPSFIPNIPLVQQVAEKIYGFLVVSLYATLSISSISAYLALCRAAYFCVVLDRHDERTFAQVFKTTTYRAYGFLCVGMVVSAMAIIFIQIVDHFSNVLQVFNEGSLVDVISAFNGINGGMFPVGYFLFFASVSVICAVLHEMREFEGIGFFKSIIIYGFSFPMSLMILSCLLPLAYFERSRKLLKIVMISIAIIFSFYFLAVIALCEVTLFVCVSAARLIDRNYRSEEPTSEA